MLKIKRMLQGKTSSSATTPSSSSPDVMLQCGEDCVTAIACVPSMKVITVANADGSVRIYNQNTDGQPIRLFRKHKRRIIGLVYLCGAVVASVDDSARIITWRVDTCEVLNDLLLSHLDCLSMKRVNSNQLLVALENGEILRVTYMVGRDLSVGSTVASCGALSGIAAHGDTLVSMWNVSKKVHVWNTLSGQRSFSFFDERIPNCVAISERYIVTGSDGGRIYVRENSTEYRALPTINIHSDMNSAKSSSSAANGIILDLAFISAHVIMATSAIGGIFFLSLASGECVGHFLSSIKKRDRIRVATMMGDGRICVGGKSGFCGIFNPPSQLEQHINNYAENVGRQYPIIEPSNITGIAPDDGYSAGEEIRTDYQAVHKCDEHDHGNISELLKNIDSHNKVQEDTISMLKIKIDSIELELRDKGEEIECMKRKMKKIDGMFSC